MNLDFSNIKVLLIGDLMIDRYINGNSNRMSPEAPVPVVIPSDSSFSPGGAANVAMNLKALGAQVTCVGYVGDDEDGLAILEELKKENINCENIHIISSVRTTSKSRFLCNGNQIMRIDIEDKLEDSYNLFSANDLNVKKYDVVILSDYNKGVLNNEWFTKIDHNMIIVDPKKGDFSYYSNANIITPNLNELSRASKINIEDNQAIINACKDILQNSKLEYIVAKKGDRGITVVGRNDFIQDINGHIVKNPDVTGAGDTVIAVLSLAFSKTNDIKKSAIIANAAASLVVGKSGTATTTTEEIANLLLK
tara:strand:+ start:2607 stop:3530 length:924 start_codon:yes stop_codon:yes gene_type:complete